MCARISYNPKKQSFSKPYVDLLTQCLLWIGAIGCHRWDFCLARTHNSSPQLRPYFSLRPSPTVSWSNNKISRLCFCPSLKYPSNISLNKTSKLLDFGKFLNYLQVGWGISDFSPFSSKPSPTSSSSREKTSTSLSPSSNSSDGV